MEKLQPKPKTTSGNLHKFTVFLMKGNLWHVRLLQLLVGGKWSSATHVIYALDSCSYEITTEGLLQGQRDTAALYRSCLDAYTFVLTEAQALVLRSYFECIQDLAFDWRACVSYCFQLLFSKGLGAVFTYCPDLPLYGTVWRAQPYECIYFPPFTCTAPMWEALGEQSAAWNCFTPAHLQQTLAGDIDSIVDVLED